MTAQVSSLYEGKTLFREEWQHAYFQMERFLDGPKVYVQGKRRGGVLLQWG